MLFVLIQKNFFISGKDNIPLNFDCFNFALPFLREARPGDRYKALFRMESTGHARKDAVQESTAGFAGHNDIIDKLPHESPGGILPAVPKERTSAGISKRTN